MRFGRLISLAAVAAVGLTGCWGTDGSSSQAQEKQPKRTAPSAPMAAAAEAEPEYHYDPAGKPDPFRYIVSVGTPVGKNDGRITEIGDGRVLVKETYVDYEGQATTKDVELRLVGR